MKDLQDRIKQAAPIITTKGCCCVESLLTKDETDRINTWIDQLLGKLEVGRSQSFGKGAQARAIYSQGMFFCERASLSQNELPEDILSKLGHLAQGLMSAKRATLWRDELFHKDASHAGNATPWHHGLGSLPFKGPDFITAWVALTDVGHDNAPLQTIRGSHLDGKRYKPATGREHLDLIDGYCEMPDFESAVEMGRLQVDTWTVKAGDALFFYESTVHGAPANQSDRHRRAYVSRWLGDEVYWEPDAYSVDEPRYESQLTYGEWPSDDLFDFTVRGS